MNTIAIIGPTNAGKSTLLNRLARRNIAITAREAGTTRDNVSATLYSDQFSSSNSLRAENHTQEERKKGERVPFLRLIDTAGLKDPEDDFEQSIQDQITDAIAAADLILVLLDGTKYPDDKSLRIVRQAQKSKKPYLIALNKSDLGATLPDSEFKHFGEPTLLHLSATTGQGIADLKDELRQMLPRASSGRVQNAFAEHCPYADADNGDAGATGVPAGAEPDMGMSPRADRLSHPDAQQKHSSDRPTDSHPLRIALIGRPNVGKSSLFNSIARKQQALVSSRQGTTRDINRVEIKYKNQTLEFLDTAGLRKPGKREVGIEKFSAIRTLAAIEESDICLLLIDATDPHAKLDQSLAGQIVESGKSIILVLTKSDLTTDTDPLLNSLERDFNFIPYAPVIITSSLQGSNITKIFELATEIAADRHTELKTRDLNDILSRATKSHPPAGLRNTRPKLRYIVQTDTAPPWFVVYGSDLQQLHWSYKRYLERQIREFHPFIGTPIFLSFKNREEGASPRTRKPSK